MRKEGTIDMESTERLLEIFQRVPRVAGTERDADIVQTISRQFESVGYIPEIEEISFIGWNVIDPPNIIVADSDRVIACRLVTWSGGIEGVDIEGSVSRIGEMRFWGLGAPHKFEKWALMANGVERTEAYLIPNTDDHLVLPYPMEDTAYVCVDPDTLRDLSASESQIRVSTRTEFLPGSRTANVIATKQGTSAREIAICAHHDTVYDDPNGLHDNGGACVVLLRLAEIMKDERTHHTIKFMATAGEEFNVLGARAYMKEREERGTVTDISACIALDFITQSPEALSIICSTEFDPIVARVAADRRGIAGYGYRLPEHIGRHTFCLDAWAFQEQGIPVFYYCPYDADRTEWELGAIAANVVENTDFVHQMVMAMDRQIP